MFLFAVYGGLSGTLRRLDMGSVEAFALTFATHLTQVSQPVLLCYPLGRLLAGSNPDGPVVGVNRRLADPEQESSEPHRAKKRPLESRVSSE